MIDLRISLEQWQVKGGFAISRSTLMQSRVLIVELDDGTHVGRGECEPHEWDEKESERVKEQIEALRSEIQTGLNREQLLNHLPAGPARNALDCALWDLEASRSACRAWQIAGLELTKPLLTAFTIGIDSPEAMAKKAAGNRDKQLLKLKLGLDGCVERVKAVRVASPQARLIVDANEAWTFDALMHYSSRLSELGVELIEQPLPHGQDDFLVNYTGPVPLCADESCLDRTSLAQLTNKYAFINIKLDKTGGLTEALLLAAEAKKAGFGIMVGCMLGTSLAMAPAMVVAAIADFVDLDGPLLLQGDRDSGLQYKNGFVNLPSKQLWG